MCCLDSLVGLLRLLGKPLGFALGNCWSFLVSSEGIGILTVVAELVVAAVIYFELKQNRRQSFLEKVGQELANEDRRVIYEEYLTLGNSFASLQERSDAFMTRMEEYSRIKERCDRQITLFNDVGITVGGWSLFREPLVDIFPHASIYVWIILRPYILKRRLDAGRWFARPQLLFTLRCVNFVLRQGHGLSLRGMDAPLEISVAHLQQIREELENELGIWPPMRLLRRIAPYLHFAS
jgi:hypothetical protein